MVKYNKGYVLLEAMVSISIFLGIVLIVNESFIYQEQQNRQLRENLRKAEIRKMFNNDWHPEKITFGDKTYYEE